MAPAVTALADQPTMVISGIGKYFLEALARNPDGGPVDQWRLPGPVPATSGGYVFVVLLTGRRSDRPKGARTTRMSSFLPPVSSGRLLISVLCLFWALLALSSPAAAQTFPFTLDFEQGTLYGWTTTGNAFAFQPTLGDNPTARERGHPSNHRGNYWIGTFEKYQGRRGQNPGDIQGDDPRGSLTSAPFSIPRGQLTFLNGGGSSSQTRVELWVGSSGDIEFMEMVNAAGGRNSETMERVSWDLSSNAGKTARIRIVDFSSGPWGDINADDFRFDPPGEIPPGVSAGPVRIAVPEVTGDTEVAAANRLPRNGLETGRVTRQETSRAEPGIVFRQSPPAGRMVVRGTAVDLRVAMAEMTVVPDLLERHIESVLQTLERARLRPGRIDKRMSSREAETVLQQSPGAGEEVPVGTQVHLVVAEPEPVVVPRVLDRRLEEARGPESEIALQPLPDPGEQVIEADGPLIAKRAGDDG